MVAFFLSLATVHGGIVILLGWQVFFFPLFPSALWTSILFPKIYPSCCVTFTSISFLCHQYCCSSVEAEHFFWSSQGYPMARHPAGPTAPYAVSIPFSRPLSFSGQGSALCAWAPAPLCLFRDSRPPHSTVAPWNHVLLPARLLLLAHDHCLAVFLLSSVFNRGSSHLPQSVTLPFKNHA